MRRFFLALTVGAVMVVLPHAQSLESIVAIGDKFSCTMEDLSAMMPAIIEMLPDDADLPARFEKELGRYKSDQPLTKGRAAVVVAKALRIRSSLFFLLFPTMRYAFRAMVVDGVFGSTSSAGDVMSGVELLDFISVTIQKYVVMP
jgi:hypothetical protein